MKNPTFPRIALLAFLLSLCWASAANPVVTIAPEGGPGEESGQKPARFLLSRTGDLRKPLSVQILHSGSAQYFYDYKATGNLVEFKAGEKTAIFSVTPVDDALNEGDETVVLTVVPLFTYFNIDKPIVDAKPLPEQAYDVGEPSAAKQLILDNVKGATRSVVVTVSTRSAVTLEGSEAPATFVFSRTGPTTKSLSVDFDLQARRVESFPSDSGGGGYEIPYPPATNGQDYRSIKSPVTFAPGQSEVVLPVVALPDALSERWEHVTLNVKKSADYAVDGVTLATVFIGDADVANLNKPPKVALVSPGDGKTLVAPLTIPLVAEASDPEGKLKAVGIHINGELFASFPILSPKAQSYRFETNWNVVATASTPRTFIIHATAGDTSGLRSTSGPVKITVSRKNETPKVALTAPAKATTILTNEYLLKAEASDTEGPVKVEFLDGSKVVGTAEKPPFQFLWRDLVSGRYPIRARAIDAQGATATSESVLLTVIAPNAPPAIEFASPTNGAVIRGNESISLKVKTLDRDGSVRLVRYFDGSKLIAEVSGESFTHKWTTASLGEHVLTAEAIDNFGASKKSAPVKITILAANIPPTVSLILPEDDEVLVLNERALLVRATASDKDGKIAKVEFLADGKVFATATKPASPFEYYQVIWTNVTDGIHAFAVRATDDAGAVVTSSSARIEIILPNKPPIVTVSVSAPGPGLRDFRGAAFSYVVQAPVDVTFDVRVMDLDGIRRVELLVNGKTAAVKENQKSNETIPLVARGLGYGTYNIEVRATDTRGATGFGTLPEGGRLTLVATPTGSIVQNVFLGFTSGTTIRSNSFASHVLVVGDNPITTQSSVDLLLDGELAMTLKEGVQDPTVPNRWRFPFSLRELDNGNHNLIARVSRLDGWKLYSPSANLIVAAPHRPLAVELTSPKQGAAFSFGDRVEIAAKVEPNSGKVAKVQFIARQEGQPDTILKNDSKSPYSVVWTPQRAGQFELLAIAVDSEGRETRSLPVGITVKSAGLPPKVDIVSPKSGSTFAAGTLVEVVVQAADADGYIPTVDILEGGRVIATETRNFLVKPKPGELAEFRFQLKGLAGGIHRLQARAHDDSGLSSNSSVIEVRVTTTVADRPKVIVVASQEQILESAERTPAYFKISRTGSTALPLRVRFKMSGTAGNGVDYKEVAETATIPSGEQSVAVAVTPIPDKAKEGPETVQLVLGSGVPSSASDAPTDYVLGEPSSAIMTIVEDSNGTTERTVVSVEAMPEFAFTGSSKYGAFIFRRSGDLTEPLLVNYSVGGSATAGSNYEKLPGVVTIPKGEKSIAVTVKHKPSTGGRTVSTVAVTLEPTVCILIFPPPPSCYLIGEDSKATVVLIEGSGIAAILPPTPGLVFTDGVIAGPTKGQPASAERGDLKPASLPISLLWNESYPLAVNIDSEGKALVGFYGLPSSGYLIESSDDGGKEWLVLAVADSGTGLFQITDQPPVTSLARIYRARRLF